MVPLACKRHSCSILEPVLVEPIERGTQTRSPSSALLPFVGEGSPKIDDRKQIGHPYSKLSTGGPSKRLPMSGCEDLLAANSIGSLSKGSTWMSPLGWNPQGRFRFPWFAFLKPTPLTPPPPKKKRRKKKEVGFPQTRVFAEEKKHATCTHTKNPQHGPGVRANLAKKRRHRPRICRKDPGATGAQEWQARVGFQHATGRSPSFGCLALGSCVRIALLGYAQSDLRF